MFKSGKIDVRAFTKFEKEHDLFLREYNGTPYWECLRFVIFRHIFYNAPSIDSKNYAYESYYKKIARQMSNLHDGWKNHGKLKTVKKCDFIYWYSGKLDKKRLFDFWDHDRYQHFDLSFESLPGTYNIKYWVFKAALLYHLRKALRINKIDKDEQKFLYALEKKLRETFGRSISAADMDEAVQKFIVINEVFGKFYHKLFEKIRPKAFVLSCYYNAYLYPAYIEAKKRNIPVIEFQHGTIINHQEYWFDDQRGINNYTPAYMLTFGELWSDYIKLLPHTKVVPVGFPFQEFELKKLSAIKAAEKLVIIYPVVMEGFEDIIIQFAEMTAEDGYKVMIKPHPGQFDKVEQHYPKFVKHHRIDIIREQDKSIYYWLKIARHHVLTTSTVAMEAAAVNGSNICVGLDYPHETAQPLIDCGIARGFHNAEELRDLVYHPITSDRDAIRELIWKSNAEDNINRFFADFIRRESRT